MNVCIGTVRGHARTGVQVDGRGYGRVCGRACGRACGCADVCADGRADGRADMCADRRADTCADVSFGKWRELDVPTRTERARHVVVSDDML